jgi:hypothetical protein
MRLDDLNQSVTAAILRAERETPDSWEARLAYAEVADLEEEIAKLTSAETAPGKAARLGAVAAALKSGDPLRATQLVLQYHIEPVGEPVQRRLDEFMAQADAELRSGVASAPNVADVAFELADTAA